MISNGAATHRYTQLTHLQHVLDFVVLQQHAGSFHEPSEALRAEPASHIEASHAPHFGQALLVFDVLLPDGTVVHLLLVQQLQQRVLDRRGRGVCVTGDGVE